MFAIMRISSAVLVHLKGGDHLPCGFAFQGPALVEQVDATTVVPPGASAEVDKYLNIIIHVKE